MIAPVPVPGSPEAAARVQAVLESTRDVLDRAKHFRPLSEPDALEITAGSDPAPSAMMRERSNARVRPAPFTLRDLYAMPELLVPPTAIIPWIAYDASTTLISAREKTGKSTLVGQAIAAGSNGTEFLGQTVGPFRTLWYAIDEPMSDTVRRFQTNSANPLAVTVQPERPTAVEMRREIEDACADVCVVDTLSRLWRGRIDSANNNDAVADFLWPYIEAARETGAALILLYHTTKAGREYRGGIELGACVDLPITLRRQGQSQPADADDGFDADYDDDSRDDGRRLLVGRGRNVDVKLRLAFDGDQYVLGDSPMPLRSRILAELEHEAASANSLAEILTTRKDRVLSELRDLCAQGSVQKRGTGSRQLYELPRTQATPGSADAEK